MMLKILNDYYGEVMEISVNTDRYTGEPIVYIQCNYVEDDGVDTYGIAGFTLEGIDELIKCLEDVKRNVQSQLPRSAKKV